MVINKDNIIIITTTLPNNLTSSKRRNNLINNFNKYNISICFVDYIKKNLPIHRISFEMIINFIDFFTKTNYTYAILCDDDFFPIDNFLEELNKTVELLPDDWECLHLCPGYLWGRKFRDKSKIGKLNPEYNMENIPYHKSGRFYINCDPSIYAPKRWFLGGPIAILVNKNNIKVILEKFIKKYNYNNNHNDVILTRMLNNKSFVCREPQLGYEEECGESTFKF
jgi:hypothetical protein